MRKFLLLPLFLLVCLIANAQDTPTMPFLNEDLIRAEMDARGYQDVPVQVVLDKLAERGYTEGNISPSQAAEIELALQEIMNEIDEEKQGENNDQLDGDLEDATNSPDNNENEGGNSENQEEEKEEKEIVDLFADGKGHDILYGHHLFQNQDFEMYQKSASGVAPSNYIIGDGDEISVTIWGGSQFSGNYRVSGGAIHPDGMKKIFLKGVPLNQAEEIIRKNFGKYYRFNRDEISIALNVSRDILVNVVGEVMAPGPYTLSATNNALSALIAAKGPNQRGSVRSMKIIRSGSPHVNFDLYEYLQNPSPDDISLSDNDYVHVPPLGRVVKLSGMVSKEARYELKDGENLKQLIEWAGGYSSNAYKKGIKIIRYEDDQEKLITVNVRDLEKQGRDFTLKNGDRIKVPKIPVNFSNFVTVEGSVNLPGEYEFIQGMKVSDLLLLAELSDSAKMDVAYLFRFRNDGREDYSRVNLQSVLSNMGGAEDLPLRPKDRLLIFKGEEFVKKNASIHISGAVRNPANINYSENIRISDIITLSGGLTETATGYGYIFREDFSSPESKDYLRVNIIEATSNIGGSQDLLLSPNDSVVVYSYDNLNYEDATINISGAVNVPSEYSFDSGMTLKDALTFAGGLKISADKAKINVYRINIVSGEQVKTSELELEIDEEYNVIGDQDAIFELNPYDQIQVRAIPDFELQRNVTISGEVRYPGVYSLTKSNERISDIIRRAGGLKETAMEEGISLFRNENELGYLVLDGVSLSGNGNTPSDYILKGGDAINIPKQINYVTIKGLTNVRETIDTELIQSGEINVPYHKGKDARFYIEEYAGGISREKGARHRLIKVRQPGGKLEKTKDFGIYKKYPVVKKGATIIVDGKLENKEEKEKNKVDWGSVISNTVAQATAILTLVILIQNLD